MRLGDRVGEGGEGVVYMAADRPGCLAKIAKDPAGLDAKLDALLALRSERLTTAAAWPIEKVVGNDGGAVGYLMTHYPDTVLLHKVFQTKSRVQELPNADWAFLVRVAKNLATCVHLVHADGLVVGDLNESNVLVSGNALVRLIDCDSFQVEVGGFRQTCDVGKGEYIPPELQGMSLAGRWRTEHQDRFPLAVLIFQLLMLGRHPFAGRSLTASEVTLEEAIARGWYAYREPPVDLAPPPGISLGWLPAEMRELFARAFVGPAEKRPTPMEWHAALGRLEPELASCPRHPRHTYWRMLPECPWCDLEDRWHVLLFAAGHAGISRVEENFDAISARLDALAKRPSMPVPDFRPEDMSVGPFWTLVLAALYVGQFTAAFTAASLEGAAAAFGVSMMVPAVYYFRQIHRWRKPRRECRKRIDELRERWNRTANPAEQFAQIELMQWQIAKVKSFEQMLQSRRVELLTERYRDDLLAHLRKYAIHSADATIPVTRLDGLRTAGLRTAADLRDEFPFPSLTDMEWSELIQWRNEISRQFWASTTAALSTAEEAYLEQRTRQEWCELIERTKKQTDEIEQELDAIGEQQLNLIDQFAQALQPLRNYPGLAKTYQRVTGSPLPTPINDRARPSSAP